MFKNLSMYVISNYVKSPSEFETLVEENLITPSDSSTEEKRIGFTRLDNEFLTYKRGNSIIFAVNYETKRVSSKAINQKAKKLADEKLENEGIKLSKVELAELKEELSHSALINTLPITETILVYLTNEYIAIDTASVKKAEEILSYIRSKLGTLEAVPLVSTIDYTNQFTEWVLHPATLPIGVALYSPFKLENVDDDSYIMFKGLELEVAGLPTISEFLPTYRVTKLGMSISDEITFDISDELIISNCKFESLDSNDEADKYLAAEYIDTIFNKVVTFFK